MDFNNYGVTDNMIICGLILNFFICIQNYSNASESFSEALKLDPDNKEIQKAHR